MNQGFVKLSRKFFENPFWNEDRMFSKCEAWLDLIQIVEFGYSDIYDVHLSKKWKWKLNEVRVFVENSGIDIEIKNGLIINRNIDYLKIPAYLYFIELTDGVNIYYKVGISSNIEIRFLSYKKSGFDVKLIYNKCFNKRKDANDLETLLKQKYKKFRINIDFAFDGYTECFTDKILNTEIEKYYK